MDAQLYRRQPMTGKTRQTMPAAHGIAAQKVAHNRGLRIGK
jgi:hypothetical protein